MKNGQKSSNLVKSHEIICHFIRGYLVESVQDILIKLDMKPCMHLVEISIFSLNHVIVRLTKIMNNLLEHIKIHTFKVIFLCKKSVESFHNNFSMKNIQLGDQLYLKNIFE